MMREVKNGVYTIDDKTYNFNFKTSLSAYEKMFFVKSVVSTIVDDDGYDYIIKDLIFDFNIIRVFTDINTSFINVKDDDGNVINPIIIIEQFLEDTNIVDIVKANLDIALLDELNNAIDLNIQYITGIHPNPLNEALARLVNTLEKKVNEVDLDSMMGMATKLAGMTEEFTLENAIDYMTSGSYKNKFVANETNKKKLTEFADDMDNAIKSVAKK